MFIDYFVTIQVFTELWPKLEGPLHTAPDARAKDRAESLQKTLEERARKEQADIKAVLLELKRGIELSFEEEIAQMQLELFSSAEREQFDLNRHSLLERLRQIPDEIEREKAAIARRFAEPKLCLFPVAVTFLAPEGL